MKFIDLFERELDLDVGSTLTDEVDCAIVWDPSVEQLTKYCKEKYKDVLDLEVDELDEKYATIKCDTLKQEKNLNSFLYSLAGYCSEEEYYNLVLNKKDLIHVVTEEGTNNVGNEVSSMMAFAVRYMIAVTLMGLMPYKSDDDSKKANKLFNKILDLYCEDDEFGELQTACYMTWNLTQNKSEQEIDDLFKEIKSFNDLILHSKFEGGTIIAMDLGKGTDKNENN